MTFIERIHLSIKKNGHGIIDHHEGTAVGILMSTGVYTYFSRANIRRRVLIEPALSSVFLIAYLYVKNPQTR